MRSMLHWRFRRAVMACFKHSRSSSSSLHSCSCYNIINSFLSDLSELQKGRKADKHSYSVFHSTQWNQWLQANQRVIPSSALRTSCVRNYNTFVRYSGTVCTYAKAENRWEFRKTTLFLLSANTNCRRRFFLLSFQQRPNLQLITILLNSLEVWGSQGWNAVLCNHM